MDNKRNIVRISGMTAKIIDGQKCSGIILKKLKREIAALRKKNIIPGLAVIIAGDDKPSHTYVRMKHNCCSGIGINSEIYRFNKRISEKKIINTIQALNNREDIHGILVQLPLPDKFHKGPRA